MIWHGKDLWGNTDTSHRKVTRKKREEEGKGKVDLILIVSGTFSKSITGPFFNTNCSVWNRKEPGIVSNDWQLQQQPMLAGPAHRWDSTFDEPLTTCPARSKKGSPCTPHDPYLWEVSVFTSARRRVNPRGCICIHPSDSLRLSSFTNRKRELFPSLNLVLRT